MGRFDDDLHLVDPSDFVPTMVDELLLRAGIEHASAADHAEVIRVWLQAHQPSPMMEYSIRDAGFGELLDEQQTGGLTEPTRRPR